MVPQISFAGWLVTFVKKKRRKQGLRRGLVTGVV